MLGWCWQISKGRQPAKQNGTYCLGQMQDVGDGRFSGGLTASAAQSPTIHGWKPACNRKV